MEKEELKQKPKAVKRPRISEAGERQWKLEKFKKELAKLVYDKHGISPPEEVDELEYTGRARGFLIIPEEFIYAGNYLSHGEKMAWLAIFMHNWNPNPAYRVSWPGREKLAAILGVTPRQVTRYLDGLRQKGLLKTRRRLDKTSLYLLDDPPKEWMHDTKRKLGELNQEKEEELEGEEVAENEALPGRM